LSGFENIVGVNPWTALFTFCNMLITFYVLGKFTIKPIKKMIDDRQNEIDALYADADNAKKEAQTMEAEYRTHLNEAKQEREEIMREANARALKREQEIIDAARADAEALREKARADIAQERKKAVNEIKDDISVIAIDIASKVTEKEIDEKKHEALIEDFIRKMGDAS
jgi:F-type H+-transporting ATPase subunit b